MQSVFKKMQVVVKQQITRYEKSPKNRKFEFEPEKKRISALHFLRLNCIISV